MATLDIITWNINGQDTHKAVTDLMRSLVRKSKTPPEVVFLQGIHSLEMPEGILQHWHAYYTQYNPNQKGVAILVNKAKHPNFTPYNQEVDRNGRYVVVQGKLLGQDYTLLSVYNHKDDITTLDLLSPYLQTIAVGRLVIGGDFNTTFGINDRAKITSSSEELQHDERNVQHEKIRKCVEKFMRSLQLVDVFREKNGYGRFDETCFTYRNHESGKDKSGQKVQARLSRLNYFFIPEEWMGSVKECEIVCEIRMCGNMPYLLPLEEDLCPLLLKLDPNPPPPSQFYNFTVPENIPQSITGVEIAKSIQSLNLRDILGRPGRPLSEYKNLSPDGIKHLKQNFNHYINIKSLPAGFNYAKVINGHYFFNVEYLIFATILAWHLEDWSSEEESLWQAPIKDWSRLQNCIGSKLSFNGHPGTSDFDIIEKMLIDETTKLIRLYKGCPLSRTLCKLFPQLRYTEWSPDA